MKEHQSSKQLDDNVVALEAIVRSELHKYTLIAETHLLLRRAERLKSSLLHRTGKALLLWSSVFFASIVPQLWIGDSWNWTMTLVLSASIGLFVLAIYLSLGSGLGKQAVGPSPVPHVETKELELILVIDRVILDLDHDEELVNRLRTGDKARSDNDLA